MNARATAAYLGIFRRILTIRFRISLSVVEFLLSFLLLHLISTNPRHQNSRTTILPPDGEMFHLYSSPWLGVFPFSMTNTKGKF